MAVLVAAATVQGQEDDVPANIKQRVAEIIVVELDQDAGIRGGPSDQDEKRTANDRAAAGAQLWP